MNGLAPGLGQRLRSIRKWTINYAYFQAITITLIFLITTGNKGWGVGRGWGKLRSRRKYYHFISVPVVSGETILQWNAAIIIRS